MSPSYAPGSYPATVIPSPSARHLLSRFTYGLTPDLVAAVSKDRHLDWFERQLTPARIKDGPGDQVAGWWPDLSLSPLTLWDRQIKGIRGGWEVMADYGSSLLARRLRSNRHVLEVMTEFWENHLHVPVNPDPQFVWRAHYGSLVRRYALGRFADLLCGAIVHPSMLIYLSAASSTKDHPNENLGRELLELHTVGVGNYTESDVKASARILTGWTVDEYDTWQRLYVPEWHATGTVKVHGFRDANASADGKALTVRYLTYLARHPDTAQHLATKLAVKFVGDTPSAGLVSRMAKAYLEHDTAIVPVLQVLVRSKQFQAAVDAKLRDPSEDVLATYRALGATPKRPVDGASALNVMVYQTEGLGLRVGSWPQPDGAPTTNQAWSSPLRALASADFHWSVANQWWPTHEITYPERADWLPKPSMAFRDLVDHLARRMLHRRSTAALLETCCLATGLAPADVVTADTPVLQWELGRLLAAVLDSPEHYSR